MGNDITKGKNHQAAASYGQAYVQTEKPCYEPGEDITGNIYFDIYRPMSISQVFLKFKYKEAFHLADNPKGYSNKNQKGQKMAVSEPFALQPGQYVFPFTTKLPEGLPNTFFQQGSGYVAYITYYLEGVIEPSDKQEPKIKYKHMFVVRKESSQPPPSKAVETPISSCCMSRGSNLITVSLQRNFHLPGEEMQIGFDFDNTKCSIDNQGITIDIKQILTFRAEGREIERPITILHRTLEEVKARKASENSVINIVLPPFQDGDFWTIKSMQDKDRQFEGFQKYLSDINDEPIRMSSVTEGTLITSKYYIEVSCLMDGKCTVHPKLDLPVEIRFPHLQEARVSAPPNWNPQIMNVATLAIARQAGVSVSSQQNGSLVLGQNRLMDSNSSKISVDMSKQMTPRESHQ